jgi:hypothetical protein
MLEHVNLQTNEEKQEMRVNEQQFAPDRQDLKIDFKREKSSSYIDYKKGANTRLDTAELGSTSFKSNTPYKEMRNKNIRKVN